MHLVVSYSNAAYSTRAQNLANTLQLDCVNPPASEDFCLFLDERGLSLHYPTRESCNPIQIDFVHGPLADRAQRRPKKNELLARAFGLHKGRKPTVIDTTAGLGRDAFLLASMGLTVLMLERSPILHALLADALERYHASTPAPLALRLVHTDAIAYLKTLPVSDYPDVIYVDPMFPERQKSALVKKEMRLLKDMVGTDNDAETLLAEALLRARVRVVVKRPRKATPLGNRIPSFSVVGSANRFDIYDIQNAYTE
jgi:16S rRNA (guanine1516-N2)-methyltransferase